MPVIIGTNGHNTLIDTQFDDIILGLLGNDLIYIRNGGDDIVDGGDGVDSMVLEAGVLGGPIIMLAPTQNANGLSGQASWNYTIVSFQAIEHFDIYSSASALGNNVTTGDGDDAYHYYSAGTASVDTIDLGGGIDLLTMSFQSHSGGLFFDITSSDADGDNGRLGVTGAGYIDFRGVDLFQIVGTKGSDIIHGREHKDYFAGNEGGDQLFGHGGNDTLLGFDGEDILEGGTGNDYLIGGYADDILDGGDGDDRLLGGVTIADYGDGGNDILIGGEGNDNLSGEVGVDNLSGGAGNDLLDGGTGIDTMAGGSGDDVYVVDHQDDVVIENGGEGTDELRSMLSSYSLGSTNNVEKLTGGTPFGQRLTGNSGVNIITGGNGDDVITGISGADTLRGTYGNDAYLIGDAAAVVLEAAGQGTDTVYTLDSYSLAAGSYVEVLSVYERETTNALTLAGNELANTIYGNDGSNALLGGGGTDTLYGMGGDDRFLVDSASDIVFEFAGGGNDTVYTLGSYQLITDQSVETLTVYDRDTTYAADLTGNNLAQLIYGNAGSNVIDGKGGADTLYGMGGADTFTFTNAPLPGAADALADFSAADDTIALDDVAFLGIGGPGALNANAFVIGSQAADADDRIVYNQATGQLFFDADGNGAGAQVLFATMNAGTVLSASDFVVI